MAEIRLENITAVYRHDCSSNPAGLVRRGYTGIRTAFVGHRIAVDMAEHRPSRRWTMGLTIADGETLAMIGHRVWQSTCSEPLPV